MTKSFTKAQAIIIAELNEIPIHLSSQEIILELSTRLIHKLRHKKHQDTLTNVSDQLTELSVYSNSKNLKYNP